MTEQQTSSKTVVANAHETKLANYVTLLLTLMAALLLSLFITLSSTDVYAQSAGGTVPGMRHRDVGAANLVEELYPSSPGYVLCISHDSIIAAIIAAFGMNPDPWPDPLQGLIIQRSESIE